MEMTVDLKILSALEKCFADEDLDTLRDYPKASALCGEKFYFSAAYRTPEPLRRGVPVSVAVDSLIAGHIKAYSVELVPVRMPIYPTCTDPDFLRREPGLYPDLLIPIEKDTRLFVSGDRTQQLYFKVFDTGSIKPGDYPVRISIVGTEDGTVYAEKTFILTFVGCRMSSKRPIVTQWFHGDCLSVYYGCDVLSERWWEIVKNFMCTAAENGINMILTPIFTPPLDTEIGGERPTVQLVSITYEGGKYRFGFDDLDRWLSIAAECGMEYIEIPHFFTQWGAEHAPKIMVTENGKEERRFGWDTDAQDKEYVFFLRELIKALLAHMKEKGLADRCIFHISDEPGRDHLAAYKADRESIADLLEGHLVVDALSDIELYKGGAVANPIPAVDHIRPFLDAGIENLWTYYCCGQINKVSNRFLAMPGYRERIIGTQMFKYDIKGFLQWGYNFWFTCNSRAAINPYQITDGDYWVPAGDAFSVYPAPDGTAYETLHLVLFTQALEDFRALETCRELCGEDAVLACIGDITFDEYPRNASYLLELREKINAMIAQKAGSV